MVKKKVVIFGAGAVGSVIAAALAEIPGLDLTLIGRKPHVRQISKQGLRLKGAMNKTYAINSWERLDFKLGRGLIIFTVKATDLNEAMSAATGYLCQSTRVLFLQNGLGIKELVKKKWENQNWFSNIFFGIVAFGAIFLQPGIVEYFGGKLLIEHSFAKTAFYSRFQDSFLPVHLSQKIEQRIWKKAITNSIFNPLSVLLRVRNRVIIQDLLDPVKKALIEEGTEVARQEGINPGIDLDQINAFPTAGNMTSMLQDFLKGKPTEIDFINGAISELGKKNNIKTPVNDLLVNLIKAAEHIKKQGLFVDLDQDNYTS